MCRSKGAAARRRKAAAARKSIAPSKADGPRCYPSLLPELLANIHDRLRFLDRISFAAVFSASCEDDLFRPSAPWLLLPGKTTETVELFSVDDRRAATVRAPAFATAEDAAWKLAPSPDGVEDAIHHDGQFYSVSYSGVVEAWQRDAESGAYASTAVTPRLTIDEEEEEGSPRKYLAAAPGGRLMVVLKYATKERYSCDRWTYSFKVHVLDDDGQWKETRDIFDVALFVGVNDSLCVPTRGRPEIEASCVYFIGDDELGDAGVYSLKDGTVKKMVALEQQQYGRFSPRPVWIMPSIP